MQYKSTIDKLQLAINLKEKFIVMCNTNQFYSKEQKRPINMYSVKLAKWNEEKGKNEYEEVFKSAQQLHQMLFLRNLWFWLNGQKIEPEGEQVPNYQKFNQQWTEFAEEYLS